MFKSKNTTWPTYLKVGVLAFIVFTIWIFNKDYATPLLLGLIAAILTFPVKEYINKLLSFIKKPNLEDKLSTSITVLIIGAITLFTLNFTIRQIIKEIPTFANGIISYAKDLPNNEKVIKTAENLGIPKSTIDDLSSSFNNQIESITTSLDGTSPSSTDYFNESKLNSAIDLSKKTFNFLFKEIVALVIFLLAWINALNYGKSWLKSIFNILPFNKQEKLNIYTDLQKGVQNVIYANILSGLIHAIICFAFLAFFGVKSLFIITLLIFLIGVLPLSPSELGYGIAILLIFPASIPAAIFLAILGEIVIIYVNYVLIPQIISTGEEGNPLLILTSILSGITIFGISGFIIGPLIMIIVQTLYRILVSRIKSEEN
jgi:predicted PurR-regulated permease PerM